MSNAGKLLFENNDYLLIIVLRQLDFGSNPSGESLSLKHRSINT